jgi:hypothetical protein
MRFARVKVEGQSFYHCVSRLVEASHGGQVKYFGHTHLYFQNVLLAVLFMRFARVKVEGQSFYHCVSRVVDGLFIFRTSERGSIVLEG